MPVNAKLHRKEFDYILKNSEASLCLVSAKVRESVEPLLGDTLSAIVDLGSDEYTDLFKFAPCTMEARGADDAAWLARHSELGAMMSWRLTAATSAATRAFCLRRTHHFRFQNTVLRASQKTIQ